jgi:hypothetical protein
MPSFSVPHSSHDTADIDAYLATRHAGQTRWQAAEGLNLEEFSYQTLKRIDQRIHIRALIIKACEVPMPATNLTGYPFLCAKAGCSTIVAALNRHDFHHELETAAAMGLFGSVDANRALLATDPRNGWDTDQFPMSYYETTLAMLTILKVGGFTTGGLNFDAHIGAGLCGAGA